MSNTEPSQLNQYGVSTVDAKLPPYGSDGLKGAHSGIPTGPAEESKASFGLSLLGVLGSGGRGSPAFMGDPGIELRGLFSLGGICRCFLLKAV
eukprot:2032294-Amphidinium_carterae.1